MLVKVTEEQFGWGLRALAAKNGHVGKLPYNAPMVAQSGQVQICDLQGHKKRLARWVGKKSITVHDVSSEFSISIRHANNLIRDLIGSGIMTKDGSVKGPTGWPVTVYKLAVAT